MRVKDETVDSSAVAIKELTCIFSKIVQPIVKQTQMPRYSSLQQETPHPHHATDTALRLPCTPHLPLFLFLIFLSLVSLSTTNKQVFLRFLSTLSAATARSSANCHCLCLQVVRLIAISQAGRLKVAD
jgi:hypothetical protein